MKVLRAYFSLPPQAGGMERHVHELSRHQRRLGVEVVQVFSRGELEAGQGFQVLRDLPILRIRPRALRDLLFHVAAAFGARRRRIQADVVHIHGDWSAFLFGRLLRRATRARMLVGSVHGHVPTSRWRRAMFRACTGPYGVLYATGTRERELLTRWTKKPWCWTASGIDECFFQVETGAVKSADVVVVGSLVPVKGIELAIEVARRMPDRRFRIIGEGPERSRLESLARRAGLDNLRFDGRLDRAAVAEAMARSRVFLITSFTEGTPTALLEAMASGLPVVTTSSNDYSALLGMEEGGAVVASRDPQALARAINDYLGNESLARDAGERNRRLATDYAWPRVAERITRKMEAALDGPRRS